MSNYIQIKNAHANNLKHVDLLIPKNQMVVITGLSGSGKSSIVFDIIDNESRRQYMESLGLITDGISKAQCAWVKGLPPSISIQQHLNNKNPRSTVGTFTELYTYIRLLFSKLGKKNGINKGWSMSEFSFNKPQGACTNCTGLGTVNNVAVNRLVDFAKSIPNNAVKEWDIHSIQRNTSALLNAAMYYNYEFDINDNIKDYNEAAKAIFLYGSESEQIRKMFPDLQPPKTTKDGRFEGIVTNIKRRYSEKANTKKGREKLVQYFNKSICPSCHGTRVKSSVRGVQVAGKTIVEVQSMSIAELSGFLSFVQSVLSKNETQIANPIISDLESRIRKYLKVNVGYLSLIRSMPTLSNGEAQRLKIANLLSSGLSGVLYILDEPTKGLHGRDISNLLEILYELKDQGNHLLLVEHNLSAIKRAEHVIDMGPGSGKQGGCVIAEGSMLEIVNNANSLTGKCLKERLCFKEKIRTKETESLVIEHIKLHNVNDQTVNLPLNKFISVAGVSGSGKSTIFIDVVANEIKKYFRSNKLDFDYCHNISGLEKISGIRVVNQKTVGRSSRSNPATYTGIYENIRKFYAQLSKGLSPSHFSFNTTGGRCEDCHGTGFILTTMHFLPAVKTICPTCKGKRFNHAVLQVRFKGLNISDILELTIDESLTIFKGHKRISENLELLSEVGVGYLQLGQEFSTLSGGEAQRIKLAKDLIYDNSTDYLYIFDEPSSGLHYKDTQRLISLFQRIVDRGNTVVVIEHNPQFLIASDYLIEIGPDCGKQGGRVIYAGLPKDILKMSTPTGEYLYSITGDIEGEANSHV